MWRIFLEEGFYNFVNEGFGFDGLFLNYNNFYFENEVNCKIYFVELDINKKNYFKIIGFINFF